MAEKTIEERLADLEVAVHRKPRESATVEDGVPLVYCNQRSRETEAESRAEKLSAANVAKLAIDQAFRPDPRTKQALAKAVKPVSPVAAASMANVSK